jgi:asparagine synthase (glutamine-hydrolysing)
MCGILGKINFKNHMAHDRCNFGEALKLQEHRGPDDCDIVEGDNFIFGHQRLSIIDLNAHAKQPMVSNCGKYTLVFNGEIYNYKEIRKDLVKKGYQFNTESDTEVLLNSYIEYGIKCIKLFIGMFAFAINDKASNLTYVVRDRLGIKPLYYYKNNDAFIFSSEIKSILKLQKNIKQKLNINAISSYLSFRYPILNDTFFKDINSLAPAHYIKISSSNVEFVEYWNIVDSFKEQKNDKGEEYYISELRKILKSSVEYRMISDVPIGSFLSGGVDSSIITAIMSENSQKPIKTFTIGFEDDGFNEFEYANIIANQFETSHKEVVLSSKNYIDTMEKLIYYKDAPLSVPNEVPLYLMSKELKKSITVVLSGEGADEIFGGYGRIFRSPYDYERIKNIDNLNLSRKEKEEWCKEFIKKYIKCSFNTEIEHFMNIYSYTSFNDKQELLNKDIDLYEIEKMFLNKFLYYFEELSDESYYNKLMYTFEKIHIVGLLHRVDTATMASSVEARVPFLDHRLVEFASTIPLKYKLKWNSDKDKNKTKLLMSDKISENYDTPKYILKKAYENMLPNKILYRKKVGFPVPLNKWLGGDFNKYAKKLLLSEEASSRKLYNIHNIEKWLNSEKLSLNHSNAMKIWMLINIELFMKKYF